MERTTVTHLSITLEGDPDERAEVANRASIMARYEGQKRGVKVGISSEEEIVHTHSERPEDSNA